MSLNFSSLNPAAKPFIYNPQKSCPVVPELSPPAPTVNLASVYGGIQEAPGVTGEEFQTPGEQLGEYIQPPAQSLGQMINGLWIPYVSYIYNYAGNNPTTVPEQPNLPESGQSANHELASGSFNYENQRNYCNVREGMKYAIEPQCQGDGFRQAVQQTKPNLMDLDIQPPVHYAYENRSEYREGHQGRPNEQNAVTGASNISEPPNWQTRPTLNNQRQYRNVNPNMNRQQNNQRFQGNRRRGQSEILGGQRSTGPLLQTPFTTGHPMVSHPIQPQRPILQGFPYSARRGGVRAPNFVPPLMAMRTFPGMAIGLSQILYATLSIMWEMKSPITYEQLVFHLVRCLKCSDFIISSLLPGALHKAISCGYIRRVGNRIEITPREINTMNENFRTRSERYNFGNNEFNNQFNISSP